MVGGLPKPAQISEAAGNGSKGARKEGSNGAGPGRYLQGGGAVGDIIWKQELGGDRGDAQGPDRIPLLGGVMDHRDDRKTWGRQKVGVPIVRGGNISRGDPPHRGVHQEVADDNSGEGALPPHL